MKFLLLDSVSDFILNLELDRTTQAAPRAYSGCDSSADCNYEAKAYEETVLPLAEAFFMLVAARDHRRVQLDRCRRCVTGKRYEQ